MKLNKASTSALVATTGEFVAWSKTTVIVSFTPRPSCAPASDAFAVTIAGELRSPQVPSKIPTDVDAEVDSSETLRLAVLFTVSFNRPGFVSAWAAACVASVITMRIVFRSTHRAV